MYKAGDLASIAWSFCGMMPMRARTTSTLKLATRALSSLESVARVVLAATLRRITQAAKTRAQCLLSTIMEVIQRAAAGFEGRPLRISDLPGRPACHPASHHQAAAPGDCHRNAAHPEGALCGGAHQSKHQVRRGGMLLPFPPLQIMAQKA